MELSTLSSLTWVALVAAAALTGLAKTAVPRLASVAAALFALALPAKESTGVMLALLLIGDAIALWAYRRDANTAVLRRLVPSVLAGVGLGALLLAVSTQEHMRRAIGLILSDSCIQRHTEERPSTTKPPP
ncbi:MAG: sulfite exporter TauE/SafE family protein [Schaalia odontolytica]